MFAYLIIGIELIILYFVFWVVFIREPKPREIRAELWGCYDGMQKDALNNGSLPSFSLSSKRAKIISFLPSRIKARFYRMG